MTLVSPANNTGRDTEFTLRRRSFIHYKQYRSYNWSSGNSTYQHTPVQEKLLVVLHDFTSILSFILDKNGPELISIYSSNSTEI